MSRIAYVNGQYVPHDRAAVHIEDRGYQFAHGVYDVVAVAGGRLVDAEAHLDRLDRSLAEVGIPGPCGRRALRFIVGEVRRRNRVRDGMVYIQVTGGRAPRDHVAPPDIEPVLVVTARRGKADRTPWRTGVGVITLPDIRWKRCDIKAIGLLPNTMAKKRAQEAGAYEAWQIDTDGTVTEGCASNAWIITRAGEIVTRHLSDSILSGITRLAVLELAAEQNLTCVERAFTVAEAKDAAEAFLTSTTSRIMPVVTIDGDPVGDGRPGPQARRLLEIYDARAAAA